MAEVIAGGIIDSMTSGTRAQFIGSFNEMVMVQKQFHKQMDIFIQVAESILNDIKDKNDYQALLSYLQPYYQFREASAIGELSTISPHSSDAEIKLALSNLKLAFQATSAVVKKQQTAFTQCATAKDKFQQFIIRKLAKTGFLGFLGFGGFESIMNKNFKAAFNKGLVTSNDMPLPWFLSNLIRPVQIATKYPLLLANLNEIAQNATLSKLDENDRKNIADAHTASVNMVVQMNQAVRLAEQVNHVTKTPNVSPVEPVQTTKPEVVKPVKKEVPAIEKPKVKASSVRTPQFFDDKKSRRHHSSHSSSRSRKSSSSSSEVSVSKGHPNTAQLLKLINLLYPRRSNLSVIEKIRRLAADPNVDNSQAIIDLAKDEMRTHKPMLSSTNQRDHTNFRQLLREISSGIPERIDARINRIEQQQLEMLMNHRK